METHRFEYSIQSMANVLGVSRSGFYQFLKRSKNELEKYNPELVEFIRETWLTSRKNYGLVRLLREVKKVYSIYGARTVRKVMKLCEIQGKQEKRFRIATTDSNHGNRLLRLSSTEFQTESEESDLGFRYYFFKILFRVDLSLCNTGSLFSKSSGLVDFKF
ncbi:hypothetical protein LEP1GSC201_1777 [Leptospira interrogans serovar Pomona str. Fox 32256]|nr:hypothetical protein LEP1GSC201_3401 [Leptospira interrogans serovar Pomona str. Fox 32256]EMI66379.1 hypothetical protein LEP1GSC200_0084 [Leptospira interrogans serovar Pomona str. CSL10083]EMF32355.1 hypothetical protein LEP1GSC201_0006 [Leptospira interrogans serovar Pomona str. Fox 32256]EMF33751.1 hypothetical protein LEP1GSC201_0442 [Leptospira interrogans serovar Pomona str. Fox 32256]EMF33762.1 hypothetical protein LEP1GSC201_3815 [Leptospira interrogans serovar Pomona str. Fox 3225